MPQPTTFTTAGHIYDLFQARGVTPTGDMLATAIDRNRRGKALPADAVASVIRERKATGKTLPPVDRDCYDACIAAGGTPEECLLACMVERIEGEKHRACHCGSSSKCHCHEPPPRQFKSCEPQPLRRSQRRPPAQDDDLTEEEAQVLLAALDSLRADFARMAQKVDLLT